MKIELKTTMNEIYVNMWPALQALGKANIKNGAVKLLAAQTLIVVKTAVSPIESIQQDLNQQLADVRQQVESGELDATALQEQSREVNKTFGEVLDVEHSLNLHQLPYETVSPHLTIEQLAALMPILIIDEEDDGDAEIDI